MLDLTKNNKWEIDNGSVLDTREIFAQIMSNQIDQSQKCRAKE
ncbi:hypothetical protein [Candidatus Uabimicrobium amorphum]|uniref:Uncharacterized protein n=1 Tax=Uabimicrobium amorphum TaxID=2596890 RepID=A0A5S9IPI2_UABAM|nr:hypothetical protein [Candidatus Uabimicrobium amorphum]BBM85330.1 hypothetical protein UABAM_03696 [Candidatus Uabimicrobium amorphum]